MSKNRRTMDGPILEIDKLSISFFTRLRENPRGDGFFRVAVSARRGRGAWWANPAAGNPPWRWGVMQDLGQETAASVGGSIKFKGTRSERNER